MFSLHAFGRAMSVNPRIPAATKKSMAYFCFCSRIIFKSMNCLLLWVTPGHGNLKYFSQKHYFFNSKFLNELERIFKENYTYLRKNWSANNSQHSEWKAIVGQGEVIGSKLNYCIYIDKMYLSFIS